ncbi:MAG: DUF4159 domain-containing protein [Vicinamibacterales bacterium]|nr:DUF4159 domain-containing protein [Vicinamibacterales bacterium]
MSVKGTAHRRPAVLATVIFLILGLSVAALAQRRGRGFRGVTGSRTLRGQLPNARYDGRFTFVRVNYDTGPGGFWYRGLPAWAHGYSVSEENLMKIMNEVSFLGANDEKFNTLALDDPEIFKYPLIYIIEVSWWKMTDREGAVLREYLQKGGFVIVDDFKAEGDFGSAGWVWFAENMKRAMPEARFVDLDASHPIFHSFFEIESLTNFPQAYNAGQPIFRGLYEDNEPDKRLQMIVNYNTDISQYWEWSGRGLRPFDETNEAYKLGVNYIMYGMTH